MGFSFTDFMAAQTAGQRINQDLQERRTQNELQKQQLEASKFQMQAQMQAQAEAREFQKQRQQIISEYDAAAASKRVEDGVDPNTQLEQQQQREIDMYRKIGEAAVTSNPTMAEHYFKMADTAAGKMATQRKTNLEIQEKKTKDLAAFAGGVLNGTVSPEEAFSYVKDNFGLQQALTIPADPAKARLFWKGKQTSGLSASEQISNQIRQEEFAERERRAREEHADRERDRALTRQGLAQQREQLNAFREESMELKRRADARAQAGGAIRLRQIDAAVNYANEIVRGLDLVSDMGAKQTTGVFAHMQDGSTILKALQKTGTNKITPQTEQMYNTAVQGLGLELAQIATAGSGRAPTESVKKEMRVMIEAKPGDKEYEVMFKIANAADFARKRLEAVPVSSDPKIQAVREKAEKALARYPSPHELIKQANAQGVSLGRKEQETMRQKFDRLMPSAFGGSEAGAGAGAGEAPDDIKDLLKTYGGKR